MYIRSFLLGLLTFALSAGLVGCDSGGSPASELGDSTSVALTTASDSIGEPGESYAVEFTVSDPGFKSLSVDFSISGATGSIAPPESTRYVFSKAITDGETRTVPLEILNDVQFTGDRTVTVTLESATNATIASPSSLTLEIGEDETSIAQARSNGTGNEVAITGVVTRFDGDGAYFQGPTGALYIFHGGDGDLADQLGNEIGVGTQINIAGETGEFQGLFQLQKVDDEFDFTIIDEDEGVPDPQTVTLNDIATNSEKYEAELVRVENITDFGTSDNEFQGFGSYTLSDGSGSTLDMFVNSGSGVVGKSIPSTAIYTGVVDVFGNNFQLYPVLEDDITSQ